MVHTRVLAALAAVGLLTGTGAGAEHLDSARLGFSDPIMTPGAPDSLVRQVESAVIISGETHEELWVHPELFTAPGNPLVIEFRARTTDRLGKDAHTTWHYFKTEDAFKTLRPLPVPTAPLWARKDLSVTNLLQPQRASMQLPQSLGHTWCAAYVYLDAQTVLQPYTTRKGACYSVQSLVARVEQGGLVPLYVSNAQTVDKGRGLYEPHVAVFQGRCFMTVRAETGRGYVLVSEDQGRTWSLPKPWTWDSGEEIPMNQTMTKFAAHSDGLALVYTRVREDNGNAFRNRSPLHVADLDVKTLSLKRATELIIVPNRSTGVKGLPVGNFWVWPINRQESYVTVAEWPRDGRPQNGDIWLCKIRWRRPNRLLTQEGAEVVMR